jgi:hypothetical protein
MTEITVKYKFKKFELLGPSSIGKKKMLPVIIAP